jgi:hypothetical protein
MYGSTRRVLFVIAGVGWFVALVVSLASAIIDWDALTSGERDRVLMMTVSWLALPAIAVMISRGYLSGSEPEPELEPESLSASGPFEARSAASRRRSSASKPDFDGA